MILTTSYTMSPGSCATCGGCDTPVIDTERSYDDGFERLYICSTCINSMANEFGFLPPGKVALINAKISDLQAALRDRLERVKELELLVVDQAQKIDSIKEFGLAPRRKPTVKKKVA